MNGRLDHNFREIYDVIFNFAEAGSNGFNLLNLILKKINIIYPAIYFKLRIFKLICFL